MQRFTPTPSGGRIAEGQTTCGTYRVEWDADGRLVSEYVEMREPGAQGLALSALPSQAATTDPSPAIAAHQVVNVARAAAHAGASIARTSLGIHRATDEQVEARLNVCRQCPGGHAVWTPGRGDVHTCGPMLASMKGTPGTCGCVLRRKVRDLSEQCPFGWWLSA